MSSVNFTGTRLGSALWIRFTCFEAACRWSKCFIYGCSILGHLASLCILMGCRFWNSIYGISELIKSLQFKISQPEILIGNRKPNVSCISQSPSEGPGFWSLGPAQVLANSWLTTMPALEPRSWLQREERKCYSRWVCSGIATLIFSSYMFLFFTLQPLF